MKIENINKAEAVMLGDEIMTAVKKIAEKYGLDVKRGGGRYDGSEYKLNNVTLFVRGASNVSGMVPSKEKRLGDNWNMHRRFHDLSDIEVGFEYKSSKGETLKLVGWDTKKRKYPVIVENLTKGGQYKMSVESFKLSSGNF